MSKYIDAEKLISEIERRKELLENWTGDPEVMKRVEGLLKGYHSILSFITKFLQQEHPKNDIKSPFTGGKVAILSREEEVTFRGEKVKIIRKYYRCEDTGREFTDSKLDDDMMWSAFRAYCEKKGMTSFTDIMLKQERPEVDLEEEMTAYIGRHFHVRYDETLENGNDPLTTFDFCEIARHFYELGLNARKEE